MSAIAVARCMCVDSFATGYKLEMEPCLRVTDFGWVGSRVSVSDPVFDPVFGF